MGPGILLDVLCLLSHGLSLLFLRENRWGGAKTQKLLSTSGSIRRLYPYISSGVFVVVLPPALEGSRRTHHRAGLHPTPCDPFLHIYCNLFIRFLHHER